MAKMNRCVDDVYVVCKVYAEVLGDKKVQMFSQRGSESSHEGVWQQPCACVFVFWDFL